MVDEQHAFAPHLLELGQYAAKIISVFRDGGNDAAALLLEHLDEVDFSSNKNYFGVA